MPTHDPENDRIKRQYFAFLKEAKRQSEAEIIERFILPARNFVEQGKGFADTQPGVQRNDDDPAFSLATDRYLRLVDAFASGERAFSSAPVDIGSTPDVLRLLGAPNLPLFIDPTTILKAMREPTAAGKAAHALSPDIMRALPEALNRPVMVFASKTQQGAMVMLTEMFDGNGKPVVAAVHFERRQGRVMVNRIASAYGRNLSQIRASLNATDTLYVDNEKAPAWATTVGLQLPWVVQPSARAAPKFKTEADLVQFRKAEVGAVDSANPDIAFSRSGGLLDTLRTSATKKGMSDLFNDSMTSRRRRESPALRKQ